MAKRPLPGYAQSVNDILRDISHLLRCVAEVISIRNLPDDLFTKECEKQLVEPCNGLLKWSSTLCKDYRAIEVPRSVELVCKAEMQPMTIDESICWTAGDGAKRLAGQLLSEIPGYSFDIPPRYSIPSSRIWLNQALPSFIKIVEELRKRVEIEVAKVALLKPRKSRKTKDAASEASPDGPQPPDAFYWRTKKVDGIPPIPWRLLDAVWKSEGHKRLIDDIGGEVWGSEFSDDAMSSAIGRANRALENAACPLKLRRKSGYIALD